MSKLELSRRSFLKGGVFAAAGAAVAGTGLVACSPEGNGTTGDGGENTAAGTSAESDMIPQASVNPQEDGWKGTSSDFATLFSPISIGSIEIDARLVKSAAGSATYLNGLGDETREYYLNFARGGCQLVLLECDLITITDSADDVPSETVEFLTQLTKDLNDLGAHVGYQWAPFGVAVDEESLDVATIQAMEDLGVEYAKVLDTCGIELLEMNCAGFNQGEQFLSRFHNTRTDEYGCTSIENRARWVCETIGKVKDAYPQMNVQVLIDCVEEYDDIANGATLMTLDSEFTIGRNRVTSVDEGIALAQQFEAAGADSMHLRLGPLGNHPCQFAADLYFIENGVEGATGYGTQFDFSRHFGGELDGSHSGAGMTLAVAKRYKDALTIPCGVVTYMDPAIAPELFEEALASGCADYYIINRPLTIDSEYINKLRDGRLDEIAPCTRCLHCHAGSNEMNRMLSYCRVNALTQRVYTENGPASYDLEPASSAKKVMVVGAGPAGMEAARIAALRGHDVTLYEKEGVVGGLLTFASLVKGPHENLDELKAYLQRQCELAGVNVVTGTEVTDDVIATEEPDALVWAAGGTRAELDGGGADVLAIDDFMGAEGNVVVYGSNAQACDVALWLTTHKRNVTIVTPSANSDIDIQQSMHAQRFMTTTLYALGVGVVPQASIVDYADGMLTVHSDDLGVDRAVACDVIVNAADMLPTEAPAYSGDVYAIGDANAPFNIALAIRSGNDTGRQI